MQTLQLENSALTVNELTASEKISVFSNSTLPSISFPLLTSVVQLDVYSNPVLGSASFPLLKAHVGGPNQGVTIVQNPAMTSVNLNSLKVSTRSISIAQNSSLTSIQLDSLAFVATYLTFVTNISLISLSLPSLVSVGTTTSLGLLAVGCTNLTTVSLPAYLPVKGQPQRFNNCALTEASVDHILARCVASANYVSGVVDLSGGTNAAPGTQGQIDKAALIARGVTVITN